MFTSKLYHKIVDFKIKQREIIKIKNLTQYNFYYIEFNFLVKIIRENKNK